MRKMTSLLASVALISVGLSFSASAQEKVRVGANPVSASIPLYYGVEKGIFKAEGLDLELTQIIGPPANLAALIAGQIDVASNLTTIDAANGNLKKPGLLCSSRSIRRTSNIRWSNSLSAKDWKQQSSPI